MTASPANETAYDDDLISRADCETLWQEVLRLTISDAIQGVVTSGVPRRNRVRLIQEARNYLTYPNRDFNEVCRLAGMDPEAVRERLVPLIAAAPSPEELVSPKTSSRRSHTKGAAHNSRLVTFDGRTMNLTGWAKELGLSSYVTLQGRLDRGWSVERALTAPVEQQRGAAR